MKRPITPPPPAPPVRKESDLALFATDPETGEQYYRLRALEAITIITLMVALYIAHALIIAAVAITIYKQKTENMETTQKTVYIAGPITNIPHGNVVAFREATKAVRNMGHIAKNPHEFSADIPKTSRWETFMRRALQQLMDCTDIVLLPGWENSDDATLEQMNASLVGITVHESLEAFQQAQTKQMEATVDA
ncbi:MAG TPA: DUF4406 domain-containing protein [Parapedobacter sp.]|uniref:DUF4406 domain-containing protein n=1 Tax=Parapedobacter sp. TaxID=1958893 RepID=UPI002BC2CA93|nr:DUF4406 domain-containing protein [Parapedobacter sp.]HWK58138.1 DUF4406 domain-containing protein [Parapedobacter sp.]